MVIERFAKGSAATAGAGAGGFFGGLFSSPSFLILGGLAIALFLFRDKISEGFGSAFENFGKIEFPSFPEFPKFPEINFPEFPDFAGFFENLKFPEFELPTLPEFELPTLPEFKFPEFQFPEFKLPAIPEGFFNPFNIFGTPDPDEPTIPAVLVEDTGLIEDPATTCPCGSSIVQDIQGNVNQTCKECATDPLVVPTPPIVEQESFIAPFQPPITLPEGFVGGGQSFIGGAIFETPTQFLTLSQIIEKFNVSASQAADILAQAKDDFGDFDFGTNTGSGIFGTPTGQENIVTGGATLESEAQRAACVSCQLFGLNCPLCSGTI